MNKSDLCFNCGRQDANHIAMYCNEQPQKLLRCSDQKCWAAARDNSEHARSCSLIEECRPLSANDSIHNTAMRFKIETENEGIKRFVVGKAEPLVGHVGLRSRSAIAEDIEFEWTSEKSFEVFGPQTMYFRVLLAVDRSIVARFDIGYRTSSLFMLSMENQPQLEKCREATKLHQTIAILVTQPDDHIEIETSDRKYRLQFVKEKGFFNLAQYEMDIK